jgi:hypothetical protein
MRGPAVTAFSETAALYAILSMTGFFTGRIAHHRAAGLQALSTLCAAAGSAQMGYRVSCGLSLGFTLLLAWIWWKGGGGDDTRRGRRRLRRVFTPTRRRASSVA